MGSKGAAPLTIEIGGDRHLAGGDAHQGTTTFPAGANISGSSQSMSIGSTNPIVKLSPFGTVNKAFFPTSVQPGSAGNLGTAGNANNESDRLGGANNNTSLFDSPLGPILSPTGSGLNLQASANIGTSNTSPNIGGVQNISNAGVSAPARPQLSRSVSHNASMESYRQTIAEIISQIRLGCLFINLLNNLILFCSTPSEYLCTDCVKTTP